MDKAFHPFVSIIIPVYNGANYMQEAIDSALAQTYKNIEVIVVNDGSNDNGETEKIALSYGDRIRYFHKPNGGVSSALNLGIKNMRGEYFSWLSHDDKYLPQKIESQMDLLEKHSYDKNLIALCGYSTIDANSEPMSGFRREDMEKDRVISSGEVLHYLFRYGCFCGCSLLIPKVTFDKCGGFDERLRFAQDFLMWLEFFMNGFSLVYDEGIYVQMRIHKNQVTQTRQDVFHRDSETICDLIIHKLDSLSDRKDNYLLDFALYNAKYNNAGAVKKCDALAQKRKLFTGADKLRIGVMAQYGRIRPFLRKTYYNIANIIVSIN